jgi:hypothetical protein
MKSDELTHPGFITLKTVQRTYICHCKTGLTFSHTLLLKIHLFGAHNMKSDAVTHPDFVIVKIASDIGISSVQSSNYKIQKILAMAELLSNW